MRAQVQIDDLELLYGGQLSDRRRRQLDEVALRRLPAVLDRLLAPLDDGRIVVLRRVVSKVRLQAAGGEQVWGDQWGAAIAEQVRGAVAAARAAGAAGDEEADAVAFDGPVALLRRYLVDALDGRLARWYWRAEAGALEAALRELAALPGADGTSHAYAGAAAPPEAPSAARAVDWALSAAGAALPELIAALGERAAPALAQLTAERAARALAALAPEGAGARIPVAAASLEPIVASVREWPAPEPVDPRNLLLVAALAIAARPSLRRAAGLAAAVVHAVVHRSAGPARQEAPPSPRPAAPALPRRPAAAASPDAQGADALPVRAPASLPERAPRVEAPEPAGLDWPAAQPTRCAGLLFLLDPLRRLDLPDAVLDEPALATDPGLGPLLYRLACCLCPEAWSDPAALVLLGADEPQAARTPLDETGHAALARVAERMTAAARSLPAAPRPDDAGELEARTRLAPPPLEPAAWVDGLCARTALLLVAALRARIDCDATAGELLDRVVLREGLLLRTPTHVDVRLPLGAVDLEVRRAALDVDPGWVPFLGRVVGFHYV